MNTLTFIRHAETDESGSFCGHSDPPVNARGAAQIAALIVRLGEQRLTAVHSSDLTRAVTTATAIARSHSLPVVTSKLLREIYFGDWEGMTWDAIEQHDAEYAQCWLRQYPVLPAPHGEAFEIFEERVLLAVEHMMNLGSDQHIAVVTHGGVMRVVLRRLMGQGEQKAWEMTKEFCSSFVYVGAVEVGQ